MSELTSKERVLQVWPRAKLVEDGMLYTVLTGTGRLVALGRATTPDMAWDDAASKLAEPVAAPEPKLRIEEDEPEIYRPTCGGCHEDIIDCCCNDGEDHSHDR